MSTPSPLPNFSRAHGRHRSSTLSSLVSFTVSATHLSSSQHPQPQQSIPPPPPPPLNYGQSTTLTLWVNDLPPVGSTNPNSTGTATGSSSSSSASSISSSASSPGPTAPPTPTVNPITFGNSLLTTDVFLNHEAWPGVGVGDVIYVKAAVPSSNSLGRKVSSGSASGPGPGLAAGVPSLWNPSLGKAMREDTSTGYFLFVVGQATEGAKPAGAQIAIPKSLSNVFGLQNRSEVTLTKVPKDCFAADYVEMHFRDQYLGRGDMWRLGSSLVNKCVHVDQKVMFVGCIGAIVKAVYVNGRRVPSAYVTSKTKINYRSMSSRMTVFIQVCRELWEFADDGERYYEKIIHFFLPSLIEKWKNAGTTHVVTIVLISRVYYDTSELEYAAGPLRQDDEGNWYKDFYKVLVDLEVVHNWKPSLVDLKESLWTFQRDILLTHHYHQHSRTASAPKGTHDESDANPTADHNTRSSKSRKTSPSRPYPVKPEPEEPPVRLVGRLSFAHEGPILEAINLGLNPTEAHYVDRSLFLTGSSTIIITPGTGHFRVSKKLLRLTTARMLDQGFGLDLVCLTKMPLHRTPVFCFRGNEPAGGHSWSAGKDMDPLWVEEDDDPIPFTNQSGGTGSMKRKPNPKKEKTLFWWEPFWVCASFWDQQNNLPFRENRFVPRARMYEIQMLGLLEHDVSSTIAIPYLKSKEGVKLIPGDSESGESLKCARDQFDSDIFATKEKKVVSPTSQKRPASPTRTTSDRQLHQGPVLPPNTHHHHNPKHHFAHRPELIAATSTSSVTTAVASAYHGINKSSATPPPAVAKDRTETTQSQYSVVEEDKSKGNQPNRPTTPPTRSASPSQLSVRSSHSNNSTSTSRRRKAGTLTSKLGAGVGTWFSSFRSAPSQPEVSVSKVDVGRTGLSSSASIKTTEPPPSPSPSRLPEPLKTGPKPITIKAQGGGSTSSGTMRRAAVIGASRVDEDNHNGGAGVVGAALNVPKKPHSYVSPISSPRDDSLILAARKSAMPQVNAPQLPPIHPSKQPSSSTAPITSSQSASLARRWQHIFAHPTLQHQIKWKSMCFPACLPLTTEYFPTNRELETAYQVYSYDVLVTPEMHGSFLLRKVPGMNEEDWPLLVMRQMAALRLAQGFQFIIAPSSNSYLVEGARSGNALADGTNRDGDGGKHSHGGVPGTAVNTGSKFSTLTHPGGASEVLQSVTDHAYLSMNNQIHRISFDPVEQVIQVTRYVKRTSHSTDAIKYECLVWPRLGDGYTEVLTSFQYSNWELFGWNRMDLLVAGYEHDLAESLRYWRTRYIVIPSEHSPPPHYAKSGERLSDEEVRLLGTDKLAELFGKARWYKPSEKPENIPPLRFLPTWLEPSACVLDDNLMSQVDELHQAGPLKKKPKSDKVIEDCPLPIVAKAMREDDGVPIKDRVWHRLPYNDSFTGYEMVSWLVREFKDVSTREQGAEWGIRLMEQGLMEHCKGTHGFLDGHYYYRLKGDYAVIKPTRTKWFRSASTIAPRPGLEEFSFSSSANLEAVATRAGLSITPNATPFKTAPAAAANSPKKGKRQLVMSQTMIIDVDQGRRSNQAETVILHHDIIQNPATAFHFELNWIGTTGRCIDDLLQLWSRTLERYGLRLVEAYVDPITTVTDKNVFQSTFPIRLCVPPPDIPNLQKRLPEGQKAEHYFEHAILRQFGYILDIEAGSRYPDTVDIVYSYRRSAFKYSQFVHKSGLAFVQVVGGQEGFRWLTNRLAGASNSYNSYRAWGGGGMPTSTPGKSSAAYDPDRRERTPTSELIQRHMKGLRDFCSDPKRLQEFYSTTLRSLPLEDSIGSTSALVDSLV